MPANVSASVSHYTVIDEVLAFRLLRGNEYAFAVHTIYGRTLEFDAIIGEILD